MAFFPFLKVRRARTIVEEVGPVLLNGLNLLSPTDRAATLAIANGMFLVSIANWGKEMGTPYKMTNEMAADVVYSLSEKQSEVLHDVMLPLQKRNMDDVIYAQGMREIRAMELLIATYGVPLVPSSKSIAVSGWKLLYQAREHAEQAADVLIQYGNHSKSRPLAPIPGRKVGRPEIVSFAKNVPPFLKKKPPVKKRATLIGARQ